MVGVAEILAMSKPDKQIYTVPRRLLRQILHNILLLVRKENHNITKIMMKALHR